MCPIVCGLSTEEAWTKSRNEEEQKLDLVSRDSIAELLNLRSGQRDIQSLDILSQILYPLRACSEIGLLWDGTGIGCDQGI